jgi:hypothetical protein
MPAAVEVYLFCVQKALHLLIVPLGTALKAIDRLDGLFPHFPSSRSLCCGCASDNKERRCDGMGEEQLLLPIARPPELDSLKVETAKILYI